jgi:hypothetical protein
MGKFHVILTDELGDEFSVSINAYDEHDAWDTVSMDYPESCVECVLRAGDYRRDAKNRVFNEMWED